jgi:hypothetical protein
MLHTFWVSELAFTRIQQYIDTHDAELYIMHAMHDIDSSRYVLLVECSEVSATYLRLIED